MNLQPFWCWLEILKGSRDLARTVAIGVISPLSRVLVTITLHVALLTNPESPIPPNYGKDLKS